MVFFGHSAKDGNTKSAKNNNKNPQISPSFLRASQSPNYRNELIRTDFVPAEPNHYWCDLGQTYLKHQNYSEAINSFNKALAVEKEPLHRAEVLYFLGASYQYNNNPAQARTSFQNSLTLYESVIDKLPDKPARPNAEGGQAGVGKVATIPSSDGTPLSLRR